MGIASEIGEELLNLVRSGVTIWEPDDLEDPASLRLLYANARASELLALNLGARIGERASEIFPESYPERIRIYMEVCRTRSAREVGEIQAGAARRHALSVFAAPVLERAVAVVFESVTALRDAESEAEQLSRFLDSIIEHIPAMVFMKDADELKFERFNRAGEALLGIQRQALLGKSDYDLFPREQADFFVSKDREVLKSGTLDIPEEPIQTQSGERWLHTRKIPLLDERGVARHLLGVSIDITETKRAEQALRASHEELERRVAERTRELERQIDERGRAEQALAQTEEQLRQAQKMEAVGRLAGGVAHDFNNILTAILSYCSLALDEQLPNPRLKHDLDEIMLAAERAGQLTRQLLAFSRRQLLEPRIVDLNEVLERLKHMVGRLIGEDIELRIVAFDGLDAVKVDVGQIEQVVLNLIVNARDAMPRGGQLTIETANVLFDEGYAREHVDVAPGPHVMLAVSDTGVGMSRETQARIFEPFFTTKELGKGTGLGLSTVFGIVKQSGGSVFVYSEPEQGAVFKLYLPSAGRERASAEPTLAMSAPLDHGKTLLVVEDDDHVREVVITVLRRAGYSVLEASSPTRALAIAEEHGSSIDLVLTDVVMPEMSGPELVQRLRANLPSLRALCMSGYTDEAIFLHGILDTELAFIQKPVTPDSLLRKVHETLQSQRA